MSSASNINNSTARVAVKVPFPDSLIEVRMSPPESNFEVKVTPGGEVIELLIRPGCSQIEVRITQPGNQGEDQQVAPSEDGEDKSGAKNSSKTAPSEEADDDVEEEVVPGVSKAEFAAMVEEDAADEAKKLLAEMDLADSYPAPAEPSPNYELPAEVVKILESPDSPEEPPASTAEEEVGPPPSDPSENTAINLAAETLAPEADREPPSAEIPKIVENETLDLIPPAGSEAPAEPSPPKADQTAFTPQEIPEAPLKMELEIEALPGEIIDVDLPDAAGEASSEILEMLEINVAEPSISINEESAPLEEDATGADTEPSLSLMLEDDFGDEPTAAIPEAVEEAARQALARLSAATHDEQPDLVLEQSSPKPSAPATMGNMGLSDSNLPEPIVDRTIMVEYIEDSEAGPDHLPDDTATPLPEEDQMDLGSVETEDEELAIGPIDLGNVDLDLEKSRAGDSEDGQTILKAKPMVTVIPNNTILPQ